MVNRTSMQHIVIISGFLIFDFLSSIYYIFMKKYLKYNKFRTYNVDKYDTNLIYKKKTFYLFLHHIAFWWSKYKL